MSEAAEKKRREQAVIKKGREAYRSFMSQPTALEYNQTRVMGAYMDYKIKQYGDKVGLYSLVDEQSSEDHEEFVKQTIENMEKDELKREVLQLRDVLTKTLAAFTVYNGNMTAALRSITKQRNDAVKAASEKRKKKVLVPKTKEELVSAFNEKASEWNLTVKKDSKGRVKQNMTPEKEAIREKMLDYQKKLKNKFGTNVTLPETAQFKDDKAARIQRKGALVDELRGNTLDFLDDTIPDIGSSSSDDDDDDDIEQPRNNNKRQRTRADIQSASIMNEDDTVTDEEIVAMMKEFGIDVDKL